MANHTLINMDTREAMRNMLMECRANLFLRTSCLIQDEPASSLDMVEGCSL